jgi:hypothetical protein
MGISSCGVAGLVASEGHSRFLGQVDERSAADVDRRPEDGAAGERPGRASGVVVAHRFRGVLADIEALAGEAAELAWLGSVHRMHASIDAAARQNTNLTRTAMLSLGNSFSDCRRVLRRIGSGTARLQPVFTIVNKACAKFDGGAKCWATAARVGDAGGAVEAGTPEEQTQRQAIECGTAAFGDGSNMLSEAEAKGEEIKLAAG